MQAAAVIPAFNEAKTIGAILAVLQKTKELNQIIVVSDGSTDDTVRVALSCEGVQVIELLENRGKGGAIAAGVEHAIADVLLFLDADLIGLTVTHVESLLGPVLQGKTPMTVGLFEKGRVATDLAQKMAPFLSGQRALRRELLEEISNLELTRFGLEVTLHRLAEKKQIEVTTVYLSDLSHVMKEEKLGFLKGVAARFKMYWEILICVAKLKQIRDKGTAK